MAVLKQLYDLCFINIPKLSVEILHGIIPTENNFRLLIRIVGISFFFEFYEKESWWLKTPTYKK